MPTSTTAPPEIVTTLPSVARIDLDVARGLRIDDIVAERELAVGRDLGERDGQPRHVAGELVLELLGLRFVFGALVLASERFGLRVELVRRRDLAFLFEAQRDVEHRADGDRIDRERRAELHARFGGLAFLAKRIAFVEQRVGTLRMRDARQRPEHHDRGPSHRGYSTSNRCSRASKRTDRTSASAARAACPASDRAPWSLESPSARS